jgi:hypothetical protein
MQMRARRKSLASDVGNGLPSPHALPGAYGQYPHVPVDRKRSVAMINYAQFPNPCAGPDAATIPAPTE